MTQLLYNRRWVVNTETGGRRENWQEKRRRRRVPETRFTARNGLYSLAHETTTSQGMEWNVRLLRISWWFIIIEGIICLSHYRLDGMEFCSFCLLLPSPDVVWKPVKGTTRDCNLFGQLRSVLDHPRATTPWKELPYYSKRREAGEHLRQVTEFRETRAVRLSTTAAVPVDDVGL